jgi:hypothetical protein
MSSPDSPSTVDYKYLLDATGSRQYAVKVEDGRPTKKITVATPVGAGALQPNETIYAFAEGAATTYNAGGMSLAATVYKITTGSDGIPKDLRQASVEFAVSFSMGGDKGVTYKLSPASEAALAQAGIGADFPRELSGTMAGNGFNERETTGGLIVPAGKSSFGADLPFPPQHEAGANFARAAVENETPANDAARPRAGFYKSDAQTLVEVKDLGAGETLRLVFNFESRRVTEVFTGKAEAALGSYGFDAYDPDALKNAFDKLVELKGSPRAPENSKPARLATAKPA